MTYTLEECDEQIKEFWAASVRTDDIDEKIVLRDQVDNWLEIRHSLIEGRVANGVAV